MVSIAERRKVAVLSVNADFRDFLKRDPRGAIASATGRELPADVSVEVVEERPTAWAFVMPDPAMIEADLPKAADLRDAVENDVYRLLRDEPALAEEAVRDPRAFLRTHFEVEVPDVDVHQEGGGQAIFVIPCTAARDELPDDLLDMVAGGGDPNCQIGDAKPPPPGGGS